MTTVICPLCRVVVADLCRKAIILLVIIVMCMTLEHTVTLAATTTIKAWSNFDGTLQSAFKPSLGDIFQSCPATKSVVIQNLRNEHQRSTYPLDLFENHSPRVINSSSTYPCFMEPEELHKTVHACSLTTRVCPMRVEFVREALQFNSGNVSASICGTMKALRRKESVNVVVFGGSVTNGGYGMGCFQGDCHDLATIKDVGKFCKGLARNECAWQYSFATFLRRHFEAKSLNHIPMSVGATTTCTFENNVLQKLQERNVSLNHHDLVIIDYSVNDGVVYSTLEKQQQLKVCITRLVTNLIKGTVGGVPTILILEYWPFIGLDVKSLPPSLPQYVHTYRQVAKLFHLPIISYNDVFRSEVFKTQMAQYPLFRDILSYKWAESTSVGIHPPWPTQDFYADLIASSFLVMEEACTMGNFHWLNISSDAFVGDVNTNVEYWVNLQASGLKSSFVSPEDASLMKYAWLLYQDRPNKAGWIVQGKPLGKTKTPAVFTLPLQIDPANAARSKHRVSLEVSYMKTYQNAGAFQVLVCNKLLKAVSPRDVDVVDVLGANHYSTIEIVSFQFVPKQLCGSKKSAKLVIQIKHVILPGNDTFRQHHKVKLTSIQLELQR